MPCIRGAKKQVARVDGREHLSRIGNRDTHTRNMGSLQLRQQLAKYPPGSEDDVLTGD